LGNPPHPGFLGKFKFPIIFGGINFSPLKITPGVKIPISFRGKIFQGPSLRAPEPGKGLGKGFKFWEGFLFGTRENQLPNWGKGIPLKNPLKIFFYPQKFFPSKVNFGIPNQRPSLLILGIFFFQAFFLGT